MEEPPPSYSEAIRQKDWLNIVAPYVDIRDCANLCRVSQRFYAVFAIRLWKNPLSIRRELRRDTSTEHQWYAYFIRHVGEKVRTSTASMVAVLDFREAVIQYGLWPSTQTSDVIRDIPVRFPNVRCILLDRNSDLDPSMLCKKPVLSRHPHSSLSGLHLLSLPNCALPLPAKFAFDRWMSGLMYLDISRTPWSLQNQFDQNSLTRANLPQLRILKISRGALDNTRASAIIREFQAQLWSLDVSNNAMTDKFLQDLAQFSILTYSAAKLQTADHFEVEGRIRSLEDNSGYANGRFYFIEESAWSADFSSPERYLADTPSYRSENTHSDGLLTLRTRSDGRGRPRGDSVSDALRLLAGASGEGVPDAPYQRDSPHWPPRNAGTTHLHLNDIAVSATAVKRLLQYSPGYIEHFECNSPLSLSPIYSPYLESKAPWLSRPAFLFGLPGAAYLFRPVISSNLRVLRVHHSLVTNTPTVACRSTDTLPKLWLAETCLRERMDLAYPQTYVPDMNPRLYSLTLCMIPRYSAGVIIDRVINFLKLAARQEQMIENVKASTPPRGPPILEGLRNIRLEFEPGVNDEIASFENGAYEVDACGLLSQGDKTFSFFSESAWDPSSSSVESKKKQSSTVPTAMGKSKTNNAENYEMVPVTEKLDRAPFDHATDEHIEVIIKPANISDESLFVRVWVGPGVISAANPPAINEYMRNLCDPSKASADCVIAATPCHVAAGVPAGSFIFRRAWDAMLLPTVEEIRRPTRTTLRGLRDVLEEIKAFRLKARRKYDEIEAARELDKDVSVGDHEHEHWRGKLVIVLPQSTLLSYDDWR